MDLRAGPAGRGSWFNHASGAAWAMCLISWSLSFSTCGMIMAMRPCSGEVVRLHMTVST